MKALTPRVALLMTLPPLMWAGNAIVGRLMVGLVPPLALNATRWALVALMLLPAALPLLRSADDRRALRDGWPYLLAVGSLGIGLFNAMQYLALLSSTPLNVTLINASMPLWMLGVGALLFAQRPQPRQMAGALVSMAGVATVIARGRWADLAQVHFVVGDLFMLAAVVGWALYSWLLVRPPAWLRPPPRETVARWGWAGFLWVQCLFGLVGGGMAAGLEALLAHHAPVAWSSPAVLAALLFVALGPSLVAYRCWGLGVALAGPAVAAFFVNLSPLFTAVLSGWLLGDWPQAYHGAAFALIVAGIVLSTWQPRAAAGARA